jgi:signal peptidase I
MAEEPLSTPPSASTGDDRVRTESGSAPAPPLAETPHRSFWSRFLGRKPARIDKSGVTPPPADAVREIVETIVFVVVLVLLLKSFAAEAFVIPTGSMAETLWGYQKVVDCPVCGFQFPVNCSSEVDPQEGRPPTIITGCTCPNCRLPIQFKRNGDGPELGGGFAIPDPGWGSGDRVLVAKFMYDLLCRLPERLNVVVFKFPGDDLNNGGEWPLTGPHRNHVPLNYIKRLLGLPGETIAILSGKIYILPPDKGLSYPDDLTKEAKDPTNVRFPFQPTDRELSLEGKRERRLELWRKPFMHEDDDRARELFRKKDSPFVILRKPPEVMIATSRIVYDNDHPAKDLIDKLPPRWQGDGWKADGTTFHGQGGGDGPAWLTYHHILRDSGGNATLITDFMGYNSYKPHYGSTMENWVGDLLLECEVAVDKAEGELTLELGKGVDRFQAVFDLSNGFCTLTRNGQKLGEAKATGLKGPGTHHVRFADFDEKLTVWVDGGLPLGRDGVVYAPPEERGPRRSDLEPARIGVKGAAATVRKVKLYRDTFYTSEFDVNYPNLDPDHWAERAQSAQVKTLYVQPNHFLCMGDNSPESSDGRSWGLVPDRLLLGRALMVYYPFYCPVWPLNSVVNRVGMIR